MQESQLRKLAQKVQLVIKEEEWNSLCQNFVELEKLLSQFRQLNLQKYPPLTSLITEKISLKEIKKLAKSYPVHFIRPATLQRNALVSPDNLVIIK